MNGDEEMVDEEVSSSEDAEGSTDLDWSDESAQEVCVFFSSFDHHVQINALICGGSALILTDMNFQEMEEETQKRVSC